MHLVASRPVLLGCWPRSKNNVFQIRSLDRDTRLVSCLVTPVAMQVTADEI